MKLSKRERYIAMATGAVVGLLVLDSLVLTPWMEARADLTMRLEARREEMARAEQTFTNLRRANRRWAEVAGGTLRDDASAAESQLLNALRDWSQEAGLTLSAVRPDRSGAAGGFGRVTLRATGAGRMGDVTRFLWNVETAGVPVRMEELQLTTRKPGEDDLSMQFTLATIHLEPPAAEGGTP